MVAVQNAVLELAGIKVRMGRHIVPEVRKHFEDGTYEWPELQALAERLGPDDVVMELGTGIGLLSAFCARAIGSGRVFTYEADPRLERPIRETYALNGVSPRLQMCMLGEPEGERTFYVRRAFWESSTIPDDGEARAITVPCLSIEAELARINPTFVVMDIEGGEYELCRCTDFPGVRKLIVEMHAEPLGNRKIRALRAALGRIGFREEPRWSNWDVVYLERD